MKTKLSIVMTKIKGIRGILSKDIAMAMGISPSYLSIIEKGKRSIPENFATNLTELLVLSIDEQQELASAILDIQNNVEAKEDNLLKIKKELFALLSRAFTQLQSNIDQIEESLITKIQEFMNMLIGELKKKQPPQLIFEG
tara:strand:+ start:145 stop:567 length:423 start_codon:yes stop_codon:yes gene_type:complete